MRVALHDPLPGIDLRDSLYREPPRSPFSLVLRDHVRQID
jgi:hypothetical protein